MKTITETLSPSELTRFKTLHSVIRKGAKTFMAVGQALVEVHRDRLYRATYPTFQAYTEANGLSRQRAYELMEAVQLTLELENVRHDGHDSDTVNIEVLKQSSAKVITALARAPKKQRLKVLNRAVKDSGGKLTAKVIKAARAKVSHHVVDLPHSPLALPAPRFTDETIANGLAKEKELNPSQFKAALAALEARIPADGNHEPYGVMLNAAATRQMNWGRSVSASAYTR